jgi:peptidyl-prolyl cis-trans isomerase A (cyclophilin A)
MSLEDLNKIIITEGSGTETCPKGVKAVVHYTERLSHEEGKVLATSRDRGEFLSFTTGQGAVIKALEIAVASMKERERAHFICPPELCYGDRGRKDQVPPGARLFYDIELIGWKTGDGTVQANTGDGSCAVQ